MSAPFQILTSPFHNRLAVIADQVESIECPRHGNAITIENNLVIGVGKRCLLATPSMNHNRKLISIEPSDHSQ